MKKLLALALALTLLLSAGSALADFTLMSNKVEIDAALKAYAALYEAATGVKVEIITIGGGADYQGQLKAERASGHMPEITVIEGPATYEVWKETIIDLSDQPWVSDTDVAYYAPDGTVVGFPVAIEGYGLGYNADLLEKAGVDPAGLTNFAAVKAAFEKIDGMKAELGIDAVVSMAASVGTGMTWVTGLHNINVYLTGGLDYSDTSIIDLMLEGKVDDARFEAYARYVALLFEYAEKDVLLTGNYDAQAAAFASGKTVFIHQGNWLDPTLKTLEANFNIGYAPHAFLDEDTDGIFVAPPSWYIVHDGPNAEEAKAFLAAMAGTPEGHAYMVEEAGMVPAFKSVTLVPDGPLSKSMVGWASAGKIYNWQQYKMPDGFGMNTLGSIYELLASGALDQAQFIDMMKAAIATVPSLLAG